MEMETGGAGVVAGGRRIPRAGIDGGGTIYGGGTSWASMGGDGGEKQRTRRMEEMTDGTEGLTAPLG